MAFILYNTTLLAALYTVICLLFTFGLRRLREGRNRVNYSVSVIVAARNEEETIGALLKDLAHQTYPPEKVEIIIADDGSSDLTESVVRGYAARDDRIRLLRIKSVPRNYSPKKYALSRAVARSSGEIILATDADCRLGSRWIETMISYFTPETGFVIGFSQFGSRDEQSGLFARLQAVDFLLLMAAAAGACQLGYPLAASGQNLAFRRSAFETVGGYSRIAHRVSGDDTLLLQLIRRSGAYRIRFAGSKAGFVSSRPQRHLRGLLNQRRRWASNGSYQIFLNLPFFAYLLVVYLLHFGLLSGLLLTAIVAAPLTPWLLPLAAKMSAELLVAVTASEAFGRRDLLPLLPVWSLLQLPYIVLVGLLGSFGKFSWKERHHTAEIRP